MKLEPGSVVLTPDEVAKLRELSARANASGFASVLALIDLAKAVRDLLTQAEADERKPVVR